MVCIEHQGRITEKGDRRRRVSKCKVDCARNVPHLCVDNGYMEFTAVRKNTHLLGQSFLVSARSLD